MIISKDSRSLFSSIFMIVIMLFLYSCSESKSEESGEGVEEVSFDYSLQFNDIDIMSADSLRYQLAFDMVGIKSLNVSIEINDILYSSFNIVDIDSSNQVIDGNLPFNQQGMNIRVFFMQDDVIMAEQYHMVPKTREVEVLTISNTSSDVHFDALFDKNKFVNNSNLIYEKFKKYDFANTEVIILNDINSLSEKIIVELQKFLLNEGYIFVIMNNNIKETPEVYSHFSL